MDCADIAVAILAAGQSKRFGSDKLTVDLEGIALGLHIAMTVAPMGFGWHFAICPQGAALVQHFSRLGFEVIENAAPEKGQSHSLHLAVRAAEATGAKALLIALADMPFVAGTHITKVVAQDGLTASTDGHKPMPPALFPRAHWPDLLQTSGDSGARSLLVNANLVAAPPHELRDIDAATDLPRPRA